MASGEEPAGYMPLAAYKQDWKLPSKKNLPV